MDDYVDRTLEAGRQNRTSSLLAFKRANSDKACAYVVSSNHQHKENNFCTYELLKQINY